MKVDTRLDVQLNSERRRAFGCSGEMNLSPILPQFPPQHDSHHPIIRIKRMNAGNF